MTQTPFEAGALAGEWLAEHEQTLAGFVALWDRFIRSNGKHLGPPGVFQRTREFRTAIASLFDRIPFQATGISAAPWEGWAPSSKSEKIGARVLTSAGQSFRSADCALGVVWLSLEIGLEATPPRPEQGALRVWVWLDERKARERRAAADLGPGRTDRRWFRVTTDLQKDWPTRAPLVDALRHHLPHLSAADYEHPPGLEPGTRIRAGVRVWSFERADLDDATGWLTRLCEHVANAQRGIAALLEPAAVGRLNDAAREMGMIPGPAESLADPQTRGDGGRAVAPPPPSDDVARLERHLRETLCVVLQGPPGTGKTRLARKLVEHFAAKEGLSPEQCLLGELTADQIRERPIVWDIVQLHPGYTYEDLVRGLRTKANAPGIEFEPQDGVLLQMAAAAREREGKPTLLVLDEINRCNLASVLGELIVLLEKDKREGQPGRLSVRLQYPGKPERLTLPPNLWILGTMNTADRSIALVDYAIRRRFRFLDVLPDESVPRQGRARSLMARINQTIGEPRLHVGHSYFLVDDTADWAGALADRIVWEVLPLLREYRAEHLIECEHLDVGDQLRLPLDAGDSSAALRQAVVSYLTRPT